MNSLSPANSWTGIVDEVSADEDYLSDPIQDYYHDMLHDFDAEMQLWDKVMEGIDPMPEDITKLVMYFIRWSSGQSYIETALKHFGEVKTQLELFLKCLNDVKQIFQHDSWRRKKYRKIQSKMYKSFYSLSVRLFLSMFRGWEPLVNPSHALELLSSYKALFQGDKSDMNYCQLLNDVLVPAFRSFGNNTWQAKDPDPMIKLIGVWDKLLPPSVLNTILEEAVLPKLMKVVYASWEPHLDTVPVDVWLRPWLPIMGDKLKNLHLVMSYKLCLTIFKTWSPNDDSVFAILSPWKSTFDLENWEKLMQNSVIPMLQSVLKEFQVTSRDVAAQKYDEFHWVTKWISLMPIHLMIDMLKEHFFPKWLRFLYDWLCSGPDSAQVEWFKGWRDVLPKELRAYDDIRAQLSNALCMMNQVAEGNKVGLHRVYLDICRNERLSFSRNQ